MSLNSNILQHGGDFLERSVLNTLVPQRSEIDLRTLVGASATPEDGASHASVTPRRQLLFLDEIVPVYIILRCPFVDEDTFKSRLSRLTVSLDTHAVGTARPGSNEHGHEPAPVKELVDSRIIENAKDPRVVLAGNASEDAENFIYVTWKTEVHLNRSRIRSLNPSIYFSASVSLAPVESGMGTDSEDEYLPSGVPTSFNLLESFQNDPQFDGRPPKLSASRLTKVIPPGATTREQFRPLRNKSRFLLRLVPAVNSRIRFHHLGASPSQAKVLASLEIEISPFTNGDVLLESINLKLSAGRVEPLTTQKSLGLPVTCRPRDQVSFVYNLLPDQVQSPPTRDEPVHTLTLHAIAALLRPIDDNGTATRLALKLHWRTTVDLSSLTKKSFFTIPHQLSTTSAKPAQSLTSTTTINPLITLTISGPRTCEPHSTLHWSLLLANRSQTRTLNLAITPITRATPPSPATIPPEPQGPDAGPRPNPTSLFASPSATDFPALHPNDQFLAHTNDFFDPPDLIPLTPDLRIGPLAPGASTTAEMRFLVLRAGVLRLEAVRVVDLDHDGEAEGAENNWMDIKADMLPDCVSVEGEVEQGDDSV